LGEKPEDFTVPRDVIELQREIAREKTIYGLPLKPDMCVRIVTGRWVYIGKIVSATFHLVVIEDIFGKRHSISLFRATAISEIDCRDLEYIRDQVLRRQRRRRERVEEEAKGEGG
jgi:hypothetical protein